MIRGCPTTRGATSRSARIVVCCCSPPSRPRFRSFAPPANLAEAARRQRDPHHARARPDARDPGARHRLVGGRESRAVRHAGRAVQPRLSGRRRRAGAAIAIGSGRAARRARTACWCGSCKLPPIVVTLGTMSVYRGVIYPAVGWRLGQRQRDVAGFPRASRAPSSLGLTMLVVARRSSSPAAFVVACATHALARELVRGRRQPGGRGVLRHRCGPHAVLRVHDLRRHRGACAATCGWRASRSPTPTSRSASSCRSSPHASSAASRSPAASGRSRASCSAACSSASSATPCRSSASRRSGRWSSTALVIVVAVLL